MQVNVESPNQAELILSAQNTLALAEAFTIDSPEIYQIAGSELQQIKGNMKALDERRKKITVPLDEAKKSIMDLFRAPMDLLTKAETVIKSAILTYDQGQERLRKAEEDRLRELADKERKRLRDEAEKRAREASEKAALLKKQAEAATAAGNAAEAAKLNKRSETVIENAEAKASGLLDQADTLPVPIVTREEVKVAGISKTKLWKARVTDERLIPREYLIVNQSALDQVAKATKGAIQIPGVEFYSEDVVRSASR